MGLSPEAHKQILTLTSNGWEGVRPLGKGGQGEAYLVRTREARHRRIAADGKIQQSIEKLTNRSGADPGEGAAGLAEAIAAHNAPDSLSDLAVFKIFAREGASQDQIQKRFLAEVKALQEVKHPNIVNMQAWNHQTPWMVTDYYPNGDLLGQREQFKGQALKSLIALRPVVEAVSLLHHAETAIVHRDIKPANIFIAADNRLVLGDFGILFRQSDNRPTELLERVGSRDWIPPWFNKPGVRVEDARPSFDVYMLGKLLWWMVSGLETPFWMFKDDELNLEKLFPEDPAMASVNRLLGACMVQYERECRPTARELLAGIDECIFRVRGHEVRDDAPRTCLVCRLGRYERLPSNRGQDVSSVLQFFDGTDGGGFNLKETVYVRARRCGHCGHIQLFDTREASGWINKPPS